MNEIEALDKIKQNFSEDIDALREIAMGAISLRYYHRNLAMSVAQELHNRLSITSDLNLIRTLANDNLTNEELTSIYRGL